MTDARHLVAAVLEQAGAIVTSVGSAERVPAVHVAKPINPAELVTLVSNVTTRGSAPTN